MSNILFCTNQLDFRGTTDQIYQYSHYNEALLGNTSYIAVPKGADLSSLPKFTGRFDDRVFIYDDITSLQAFSDSVKIDTAYWLKYGTNEGIRIKNTRNVNHVVFTGNYPHGDRYCAISKWLGDKYSIPYVPHIVSLPDMTDDYRELLNIPNDAIVFGRLGGHDSFDDPIAHRAVYDVAYSHPNIFFLFLNTDAFCLSLPNIMHIEPTYHVEEKTAFINTCDAIIHGRLRGETFGLAVCEALHQNKPVITNIDCPERNHIQILGDKGIYYQNYLELSTILSNFVPSTFNYRSLVSEFHPKVVMRAFDAKLLH